MQISALDFLKKIPASFLRFYPTPIRYSDPPTIEDIRVFYIWIRLSDLPLRNSVAFFLVLFQHNLEVRIPLHEHDGRTVAVPHIDWDGEKFFKAVPPPLPTFLATRNVNVNPDLLSKVKMAEGMSLPTYVTADEHENGVISNRPPSTKERRDVDEMHSE